MGVDQRFGDFTLGSTVVALAEAISLLDAHGPEASVLAGGQSLIPMMKLQLAAPGYVIDINRLSGLADIREDNGFLHIGSLTREADLDRSELVRVKYPILHDTTAVIADPLVRNMATVGGNLAHGDPANDHPATMLALGAVVAARGPDGERVIPVSDFFEGPLTTALNQGEILTEIRVPTPPEATGSAYLKLERKVGDYATAGVAAVITVNDGVWPTSRHRPDQCRADTRQGPGPLSPSWWVRGWTRRPFVRPRDWHHRKLSRPRTYEVPKSTSVIMVRVLAGRALRLALERIS